MLDSVLGPEDAVGDREDTDPHGTHSLVNSYRDNIKFSRSSETNNDVPLPPESLRPGQSEIWVRVVFGVGLGGDVDVEIVACDKEADRRKKPYECGNMTIKGLQT